jgi:2-oxoisovalerate dehydrogenase E1 component beta subunit
MVHTALEAAEKLAEEGIGLEVVDLRTLLPLDRETILASVRKTNKVILLHEDTRTGGMAGEIAALICEHAFEDLDGPILRVTAPDTPVPFSPPLEQAFLPGVANVVETARQLARY